MTEEKEAAPAAALVPRSRAPDFQLRVIPDELVSLTEFHGTPVVPDFYLADLARPVEIRWRFTIRSSENSAGYRRLLGISVDGVWCHAAFAKDRNLHFPLLADFEPKGAVACKYGVYRQEDGISERALFVISKRTIAWNVAHAFT